MVLLLDNLEDLDQFSGHLRNGFDSLFALDISLTFPGLISHLLFALLVVLAEIQIQPVEIILRNGLVWLRNVEFQFLLRAAIDVLRVLLRFLGCATVVQAVESALALDVPPLLLDLADLLSLLL